MNKTIRFKKLREAREMCERKRESEEASKNRRES
jgi:hypothetical protein